MKKKEKGVKIGQNMSSGAEKIEELAKGISPEDTVAAQGATGSSINTPASQNTAAYTYLGRRDEMEKEEMRRATRLEAQAARRRVQKAVAEKQREERADAIRRARAEKRATWREEYAEALEREKKNMDDKKKDDHSKRTPGIGGWIAAVVTLGTTTLALTTVVAVGTVQMNKDKNAVSAAARGVLYEFVSVVENMEEDLDEVQVVTSAPLKSQLLTSVVAQARMAEVDLEKLPFSSQADGNLTTYLNATAYLCEGMLGKLRVGEPLTERDERTLKNLHEISEKVSDRLEDMMDEMQDKDMMMLLTGKECCIGQAMKDIEGITIPKITDDRRIPPRSKESPSMQGRGESTLTSSQAKEYCLRYFADYGVTDATYDGETVSRRMCAYNFSMQDKNGVRIFAQIDEKDGALIAFDYYQPCTEKKIDAETCLKKAQAFLKGLGYEHMTAVESSVEGTNVDIRFVLQKEDVVHYGKEVTVKVCMERAQVVGLNAEKYLENKEKTAEFNATVSMQEARDRLDSKLVVESTRSVVFPYRGKTYSAYEFFCSYDGGFYYVYADATTGNQLFVKRV